MSLDSQPIRDTQRRYVPSIGDALPRLEDLDSILIVKTSSIGDVIHATPVVEALKKARPSARIGWLVRQRCAGVLQGNPNIDRLHVTADHPGLSDLIRLRRELRSERYACVLEMQGLFLSGLYGLLSGAPIRIGLDRNREGNRLFLTHPVVPGKPGEKHAVDILYGFAEALGVDAPHPDFAEQAYLAAAGGPAVGEVDALRRERHGRPVIGLNVGASWTYKRWPVAHWQTLAQALLTRGHAIVFVGSAGHDSEAVAEVRAGLTGASATALDLSGRTTLTELAAVLKRCDLLVTADTGPMHLGVAVATPVVALFGATNPVRTGPYGARNHVLNLHLPCSPCYRKPTCDGRVDCMQGITPDTVLAEIEQILRSRGGAGA
jgi:lipopolysaccharide heptosyltransferase I